MARDRIYSLYCYERWCYLHHLRLISIAIRAFIRLVFSADIPYRPEIGEGTEFPHDALGIVIHPDTRIGKNCKILHGTTIGGRGGVKLPIIGDNVLIGANSCILGGIIIGDNVKIGAGSVVVSNIPKNTTVVGNPAKVVKVNNS